MIIMNTTLTFNFTTLTIDFDTFSFDLRAFTFTFEILTFDLGTLTFDLRILTWKHLPQIKKYWPLIRNFDLNLLTLSFNLKTLTFNLGTLTCNLWPIHQVGNANLLALNIKDLANFWLAFRYWLTYFDNSILILEYNFRNSNVIHPTHMNTFFLFFLAHFDWSTTALLPMEVFSTFANFCWIL